MAVAVVSTEQTPEPLKIDPMREAAMGHDETTTNATVIQAVSLNQAFLENSQKKDEFLKELSSLLNRHGIDAMVETEDFILAEYLLGCLKNVRQLNLKRDGF